MKTPMKFLQTCTFAKKSHCGTLYLRDSQTSIMELYYFFFKHSFVDVWLGPKYPSEKTLKDKAGIFT